MSCPSGDDVCIRKTLWNATGAMAHLLGGALWILGPVVILKPYWHIKWTMTVTYTLLFAYALPKELWWDEVYETGDESGAAWVDIVTYLAGGILGILLSLTQLDCYGHGYTRVGV